MLISYKSVINTISNKSAQAANYDIATGAISDRDTESIL